MHALGDRAQAARAVIDGVHRRDDGEKNLRRANVARRFVAPDVLLARLQSESIRGPALGVVRNADETSGHVTFVLIARREIGGVRPAESERNTETLRAADGNIGAKFSGRFQQRERENVGGDDHERAGVVRGFDEIRVIENRAVGRRILNECAKD